MKKVLFIGLLFIAASATAQEDHLGAPNSEDTVLITRKRDRSPLYISPNPFIQSATIIFKLKKESVVTLEVFDIGGRIVRSFEVSKPMKPGTYYYVFDASKLRPGVYLCRLNCDGKISMKKMVREK